MIQSIWLVCVQRYMSQWNCRRSTSSSSPPMDPSSVLSDDSISCLSHSTLIGRFSDVGSSREFPEMLWRKEDSSSVSSLLRFGSFNSIMGFVDTTRPEFRFVFGVFRPGVLSFLPNRDRTPLVKVEKLGEELFLGVFSSSARSKSVLGKDVLMRGEIATAVDTVSLLLLGLVRVRGERCGFVGERGRGDVTLRRLVHSCWGVWGRRGVALGLLRMCVAMSSYAITPLPSPSRRRNSVWIIS
mmetsp:Transcript_47380/g.119346  ORF Transcript_47380/g.119346 Transcript_47380/m.119346 type:complete len:241 (+) Transcript_47380:1837-2559(+)